jgi:hypothetical protein
MTSKSKEDILKHFTTPKCKTCGTPAEITQENDGGCGNPECCGERIEWTELKCPKCYLTENLRYV